MTSRALGLFDQEIRQRKLQALGDSLVELDSIVPWGMFRETLETMCAVGLSPPRASTCSAGVSCCAARDCGGRRW